MLLIFLKIIHLTPLTAKYPSVGPRIVRHVIFSLQTILFPAISQNVRFQCIASRQPVALQAFQSARSFYPFNESPHFREDPTNNLNLSTPFRRKREKYWIRQLGIAAPYSYNDHIDSIGNLTSPGCQSVNVLNLFDRTSRRPPSHGSRRYNKSEIPDGSFDGLLPFVNLQLGLHHIRTRLYSLPLKMLHELYESTLTLHFTDAASAEHRLQDIILDISSNRLFKVVRVGEPSETRNRPFLKVKFANKGIDALNLSNMLNQKSVQSKIPHIFNTRSRHAFLIAIPVPPL